MNFIGNRYELLNCEEELNLNKIYKARDAYDNKKVLIKIIEHNSNICEDFISNLIDENTMLQQINSPYILKIIDVGIHCTELTTLYYIVSEYYEAIALEDIIRGNYLHIEAIVNIATQIVKALESVHIHNMYHGDLNPSNIMVDKAYNIKVCNFTITKANKGINIRACDEIKYLSPHQLCINYTDLESDFFTLGLILFEAIFKKLPYNEVKNEEEMLKNIDKGINWNELKAINGNYKLINIIKKLLHRSKKYANMQEIIIDLSMVIYEKADIEEIIEENINENNEIIIKNKKSHPKNKKSILVASIISLILITLVTMI